MEGIDKVEFLMDLHKEIKKHLLANDVRGVARIMKIYSHRSTNLNILKTILLATKSFKEREEISLFWNNMNELYYKKYNKL